MARVRVSYGRCKRVTFNNKKNQHKLIEGRLYYITDTGEILRANSDSTYESYSSQIHVVDEFPTSANYIQNHIYIKKSSGRAKVKSGDTIYELQCEGSGSGGGGGSSEDLRELELAISQLQEQLTWKTPE